MEETRKTTNMFDDLLSGPDLASGSSGIRLPADELALYLSSGVEYLKNDAGKPGDPLKWWREHRDTYPRLAAMASDYLSIPCMSFFNSSLFLGF
jgi:hypothetical protein